MGERREANRLAFYANPDDERHGTPNGYNNLGCRCTPCTAANTEYHLAYMRRSPEQRVKAADSNLRRAGRERKTEYQERPHLWRELEGE
jgi:hypothetical protein